MVHVIVTPDLCANLWRVSKATAARQLRRKAEIGEIQPAGRQRMPGQRGLGTPLYLVALRGQEN